MTLWPGRTQTGLEQIERRHEALKQLAECAKWIARRDELVRQAVAAGVAKPDIAVVLGIDRSTVYDILARQENNDGGL